jgi:2-haloacid dehalogenase/putative hydrolase of the HAD superfamily
MKDYQWITFDCYGTLIDWETGICAAFEKVAKTSGIPFDRKKILTLYGKYEMEEEFSYKKYREVLTRVAKRICSEMRYRPADFSFLAESLPRWRPFADTLPVLQRLARNFKLGILSNIDNDLIAETRRHFTVPFELIVTAEQAASYKPETRHWQDAKKKIGSAKWIHVAQSFYHDIIPCSRLAIDAVWINRNEEKPRDPKIHPILETPNLYGFANWIEEVD